MTDLTEKLKKGELERGTYYIRCNGEAVARINAYVPDTPIFELLGVDEVLAPVPSYEEYLALKEKADGRDNN